MPDTTKFGYPSCLPAPGSSVTTTATSSKKSAVAGVTFGSSDPAFHLDAVWAAGDHLELVSVDRDLGALTTTKQRLTVPALDPFAAVLGANVFPGELAWNGSAEAGAGQEVLAGRDGEVGIAVVKFFGGNPQVRDLYTWEYRTVAISSLDGFGSALAAPPVAGPGEIPWVAVGAPGSGRVSILARSGGWDHTTPAFPPMTQQQLLTGGSASQFGTALVAGDFDSDGLPDLAVGAPLATAMCQDGTGASWSVFLTEESRLGFWNHADVVIPLEMRNGDPCVDSDLDPVAEVVIPTDPPILPTLSLASDARDVEVCLEDENGMRAEWYWSHFASSEEFLVVPIDGNRCDAVTDGIRIAKVGSVVCEP